MHDHGHECIACFRQQRLWYDNVCIHILHDGACIHVWVYSVYTHELLSMKDFLLGETPSVVNNTEWGKYLRNSAESVDMLADRWTQLSTKPKPSVPKIKSLTQTCSLFAYVLATLRVDKKIKDGGLERLKDRFFNRIDQVRRIKCNGFTILLLCLPIGQQLGKSNMAPNIHMHLIVILMHELPSASPTRIMERPIYRSSDTTHGLSDSTRSVNVYDSGPHVYHIACANNATHDVEHGI